MSRTSECLTLVTAPDIARQIGRSTAGVYKKLAALGIMAAATTRSGTKLYEPAAADQVAEAMRAPNRQD